MKIAKGTWAVLLPWVAAGAQYSGKVGGGETKPVLRALAVYEYTGALAKPNASRLVPVAVWDGVNYQPGGLYLARPEPLAVAPGTQYVLEQGGVPQGYFNIGSAAKLSTGGWVGLGRFQAEAPPPAPAKLKPSKQLPTLTGGSGRGKAEPDSGPASSDDGRPTLHRKTDSKTDSPPPASGGDNGPTLHKRDTPETWDAGTTQADPAPDPDRPTLHRKDTSDASPAPDPDRPTLHKKETSEAAQAPDPDRPTLHRKDSSPAAATVPDPDRPHLRYGGGPEETTRVAPALLEAKAKPGSPVGNRNGAAEPMPVADAVAVSDTETDDPHPFAYAWPDPKAQTDAEAAMHALALRALASAAQATFGPAATGDAALRKAADAAQASFGPGTKGARKRPVSAATDPLVDAKLSAFELSYGAGATYVYSAHTAPEGPTRRYVTLIAQPDFYGKPQVVFSQTTRGELLNDSPALRLVDAVDADGDKRAELLFSRETADTLADASAARQFALYGVVGGRARLLFATQ